MLGWPIPDDKTSLDFLLVVKIVFFCFIIEFFLHEFLVVCRGKVADRREERCGFKSETMAQRPISLVLEKIRKRKMEVSKKCVLFIDFSLFT